MKELSGRLAVITGGGTGMGRALARALIAEGCHVAVCDLIEENLAETKRICTEEAPQGVRVSTHVCDVVDEDQLEAFRASVQEAHQVEHINLLFNNAGVAGGGSFVLATRTEWERTFDICWRGVYLTTRVFLPLLMKSSAGHVINTSSVNGFHAALGGTIPHSAYSSAKFAVKGFTEALISDFRFNAPHLQASVVMPGYVGTQITVNTGKILDRGNDPLEISDEVATSMGIEWHRTGATEESAPLDADAVRARWQENLRNYDQGGLTSDEAALIILNGVKADEWRILVGPDAIALDEAVRANPVGAYDPGFAAGVWASMDGEHGDSPI